MSGAMQDSDGVWKGRAMWAGLSRVIAGGREVGEGYVPPVRAASLSVSTCGCYYRAMLD